MGDTEKRITAKMVLDSTGYNDKLKGLNAEMKKHQAELKLASSGIQAFGKDSEKLKSVQEALAKQVELHSKKVDMYKQSIEKANTKMQDNIKTRDNLKESLTKANAEYEKAVKTYGKESEEAKKAKEEVDKLKQEHEKASKSVETNAKQVQGLETNMNKANAEMVKAQGELKKVNGELDKSNNKWLSASKGLKEHSEKLKSVGGSMEKAGEGILKLTAPLAAAGIASLKFSTDFSDGMAKVSTIADSTKVPIESLREGALKLSKDFGVGATEITESMYQAISASVPTEQALDFVAVATKSAKGGFTDAATAVDGLSTVLNSYGMEASKADVIANQMLITQNKGKTTFGELASAVGKVTPITAQLGVTTEELFSSLASTTAQGLATAESVTAVKAAMSNIIKPSKEASEAAEQLGIDFSVSALQSKGWIGFLKDLKSGLENASPEFADLSKRSVDTANRLAELEQAGKKNTDEYKELKKASKALGKEFETLSKMSDSPVSAMSTMFGSVEGLNSILMLTSDNGMKIYNETMEEMKTNTTALDDAFEKMSTTPGEKFRKSLNSMKVAAIQFGDALAPMMEKASGLITSLADKLSGLSKEQLESIAKWGTMAIASGGALKILGGGLSTLGSLAGGLSKATGWISKFGTATEVAGAAGSVAGGAGGIGAFVTGLGSLAAVALPVVAVVGAIGATIYTVHESNKLMGESCIKSAEEMGFMERAIASTNGTVFHTNAQLEEMNIKHKEWSSDVAPDVQKSLEDCSKRIADYSFEVENATQLDEVISDETGARLNTKLDNIANSAIEKIKQRAPETQKEMAEAFKADDGKLDENEKKLMEFFNKSGEEQIKQVNDLKKKINDIWKNAKDKNVAVTKEEKEEIAKLTQEIGTIELQNTANTKQELLAAQAEFNARMKNLDMKGVSDLLAEKAKARDEEREKIKLNYDKHIELLKLNMEDMSKEQQDAAEAEIAKLEEKKQQGIQKEEEKYKGYLDTAKTEYPNLVTFIDQKNGEMLTNQQKQKLLELGEYGNKMEQMLGITQTGYYKIKDSVTGSMHDCYVEVDTSTGQINGVWDNTTKKVYGNPIKAKEEIDQDLKNGQAFQPIADSYDEKKEAIYKNAIEVDVKKRPGLFDWVKTAWNGILSFISSNPANIATTGSVGRNYTGTNYWKGGLTYLHDQPGQNSNYELYDLPRGTRVFNHDASADLVMKTAESVATKVANSVLGGFNGNGGIEVTQNIFSPTASPSELARQTKNNLRELALNF